MNMLEMIEMIDDSWGGCFAGGTPAMIEEAASEWTQGGFSPDEVYDWSVIGCCQPKIAKTCRDKGYTADSLVCHFNVDMVAWCNGDVGAPWEHGKSDTILVVIAEELEDEDHE